MAVLDPSSVIPHSWTARPSSLAQNATASRTENSRSLLAPRTNGPTVDCCKLRTAQLLRIISVASVSKLVHTTDSTGGSIMDENMQAEEALKTSGVIIVDQNTQLFTFLPFIDWWSDSPPTCLANSCNNMAYAFFSWPAWTELDVKAINFTPYRLLPQSWRKIVAGETSSAFLLPLHIPRGINVWIWDLRIIVHGLEVPFIQWILSVGEAFSPLFTLKGDFLLGNKTENKERLPTQATELVTSS